MLKQLGEFLRISRTVMKAKITYRNHPGNRTILWSNHPLVYFLPPIPGLTRGNNYTFNKKYEGEQIRDNITGASANHPNSVQTDRMGYCGLRNCLSSNAISPYR